MDYVYLHAHSLNTEVTGFFPQTRPVLKSTNSMKTKSQPMNPIMNPIPRYLSWRKLTCALLTAAAVNAGLKANAANQSWTNTPVDANWGTLANWSGNAAPGAFVANGNVTTTDIATFTNAIFSGIGSSANPITPDMFGTTNREVGGLTFDQPTCGAYVIGTSGNVGGNVLQFCTASAGVGFGPGVLIGATETSPISIQAPIFLRPRSSTGAQYEFTNNAASPNATLSFDIITNGTASTRPLIFILAGSNTGSNVIQHIDNGVAGQIHLIKAGAGRWVFLHTNDLRNIKSSGDATFGSINVAQGTLEVEDPGSLGGIVVGNLWVTNTGVLQIDNVTLNNNGITLQLGGTLQMNGAGVVNGVTVSSAPGQSVTVATTSSTDALTVGTNSVSSGAADSVIHVAGPGLVALSPAVTTSYIGKWSVDAGTLQLTNAGASIGTLGAGANLNIAAGATFDVSPAAANYALTTAAISANGHGTAVGSTASTVKVATGFALDLATGTKPIALTFTPTSFSGDTAHPALYVSQGNLTMGGNTITINNAGGTALGAGTYTLISVASGIITDGGGYAVAVSGSGVVGGATANVVVSGGSVNLVVALYTPKHLVWSGTGSPWDVGITSDWLNGATAVAFTNADFVTFNSVGIANPNVNLTTTLAPSGVLVDTTAGTYTFGGTGSIAGNAGLTKVGAGTLDLNTVNSYYGNTFISNGVIQVGAPNALPGNLLGGDVIISNSAVLDLFLYSDTINGLSGNGTVDITGAGAATLTIGNNNDSGTFSGIIKNTSGTINVTHIGNGTETLSGANSYTGNTTINAGTLLAKSTYALGAGVGTIALNGGLLDVATNILVGAFGGSAGIIANNSSAVTNLIICTNGGTLNALMIDGTGGAGLALQIPSGTLRMNAANTYSGGTYLASGATLQFGVNPANGGNGMLYASNGATLSMPTALSSAATPFMPITTVDGATVTFTSASTGNGFNSAFFGGPTATNLYANGAMTIGGTVSFSNFVGTVIFSNGIVRWNQAAGAGGANTLFEFMNGGGCNTRDSLTAVQLGALIGDSLAAINGPTFPPFSTYVIGGKGIDTVYAGSISGSNSITKVGPGRLTLSGVNAAVLLTDGSTYTNFQFGPVINHLGSTVVSNGVLAFISPNTPANSSPISLAGGTIDATKMGYVTNYYDINGQNSALITNGVFEVTNNSGNLVTAVPQTLNGYGTITGKLQVDAGAFLSPGLPTGNLIVSSSAEIAGTVTMTLNRTNSPISSKLTAASITIDPTATLLVTNRGPSLANGTKFTLFSTPVAFPAGSITLPITDPTGTTNYVWTTNLTVDGSITLVSGGVNPIASNPTNMVFGLTNNVLTIQWPADHTGWLLQVQTNSLNAGLNPLTNSWFTIPGTSSVDTTNITVNPTNPTVFFRLVSP